jgi:hypothetical protein
MKIIGVDFSGARADRNTWMARGVADGPMLTLAECQPISRAALSDLLAGATGPTVAALDLPFSVPQAFAEFWAPQAQTMPDLWAGDPTIFCRPEPAQSHTLDPVVMLEGWLYAPSLVDCPGCCLL